MLPHFRSFCVLTVLFGTPSAAFSQVRSMLPNEASLGRLGLQRGWWSQASLDIGRDEIQYFSSDEQITVVQTNSGLATAIDNATGRRRWSVQVGAATDVRFPVTINEQFAMIVSGTTLYALDKKTGNESWRVRVPSPPAAPPASDDTHVYVGAIDGYLYCFSTKILDELMKNNELDKYPHRVLRWQYKTGGRIRVPPVSMGSIVHVASSDGSLYGLMTADCKLRYQFETDRPVSAPLALLGDRIFLCTADRKVYCLRADTGALLWERLTGWTVQQQPRAIGEHLFLLPLEGGLRCLETATGKEVWSNMRANGFLAATPTTVYASTGQTGEVMLLDRASGRPIGMFSVYGFPLRIANDRTDRMYFASPRGLVVCIRERDREFPLYHKAPEKRPVLPEVAPEGAATKPTKKTEVMVKPEKKEEVDEPPLEKKPVPPPVTKPSPPKKAPKPKSTPAKKPPKKPKSKPQSPGFDTDS